MFYRLLLLLSLCFFCACAQPTKEQESASSTPLEDPSTAPQPLRVGAERIADYDSLLRGKRLGMVVNASSLLGDTLHLVDYLQKEGYDIKQLFAPEHGIRGKASAGEHIDDGHDAQTGLPIISLYGANKKPKPEQLANVDLLIFDLQDVGTRFYTYISTMHLVMEACREAGVPLIVLDRPNPNGHYVDGPVLDTATLRSFIGMHPIPIVHGLTVGELAQMIVGEKWIEKSEELSLTVIPCENYTHQTPYVLPVRPSPNLPNTRSIALYPTLCLFEGTALSVGRGTDFPFQVIGHPAYPDTSFQFTPKGREGAKNPKFEDKTCYGKDLRESPAMGDSLWLGFVLETYRQMPNKNDFFKGFFDKLAGTTELRKQIENGASEAEIRASWQPALNAYKTMRTKYLLYNDGEASN